MKKIGFGRDITVTQLLLSPKTETCVGVSLFKTAI